MFFKEALLPTSPLPFSQTRVPRDSSIGRALLSPTDTRTGRDQPSRRYRTSQPTYPLFRCPGIFCKDLFFFLSHTLCTTRTFLRRVVLFTFSRKRDEHAITCGFLRCSDITGMASSSVSQEDFENDFELTSRRSRIRTARARVGPARTGDVSSISFQSTWRKCL